MSFSLEQAIYTTVRYFDVFDMPLTATQIWRCLLGSSHAKVSLKELQTALRVVGGVSSSHGYYFLAGRQQLVRERLIRHSLAQQKWKIVRALAPWLSAMPFVRAISGSGSLAIDNTKPSSDLDLFVIVEHGHIWTARLWLLLLTQLLGRRRKYWNRQAPDQLCLNHYISDQSLVMPVPVRNLYTAVQYSLHVPIFGVEVMRQFRAANAPWIHQYVVVQPAPHVHHAYTVALPGWLQSWKQALENMLREPALGFVETLARRVQLSSIRRHQQNGQAGRVAVSDQELAFHPDTKVPSILEQFMGLTH